MEYKLILDKGDNRIHISTGAAYDHKNGYHYRMPNALIRKINQNLLKTYKLYEFRICRSKREESPYADTPKVILRPPLARRLLRQGGSYVYFEELDPVLLYESDRKSYLGGVNEEIAQEIDFELIDMEYIHELHLAAVSDLNAFVSELSRQSFRSFTDFRSAVGTMAPASLSIYDHMDIYVYFNDSSLGAGVLEGLEEYLV